MAAIAKQADAASIRHHGVPPAFFAKVLGPNLKYSSCFYKEHASTLQEAEEEALSSTPISPTANRSFNSAAAGVHCRCGWRGSFPHAND
jgi:cyclopropane-fatty-acyl-phospholipid synthase